MQMSIHVQSDGAPVGPKRARSSLNALADIPDWITSWNLAGTLSWLDRIRAAETAVVQVCQRIWTTVDTTHVSMLIELRSHSEPGEYEPYSGLVDGMNDSVGIIARRFSLDLLSLSYNEPTRDLFSQTFSLPRHALISSSGWLPVPGP